jgi:hypothetical protein
MLCNVCDENVHTQFVLHDRMISHDHGTSLSSLAQYQFLDSERKIVVKDVSLPCFMSTGCVTCGSKSNLSVTNGSREVAVITTAGRFDIKTSAFYCSPCETTFEARTEDYVVSGYWPGTANDESFYLMDSYFLVIWYHLQHKSPSIISAYQWHNI